MKELGPVGDAPPRSANDVCNLQIKVNILLYETKLTISFNIFERMSKRSNLEVNSKI